MGDDIRLNLEFYRMEEGQYPDTPNATRRIALDGVPSHREPGSVPLSIVLRGATRESRKTQKTWPRAFNATLLIGDLTGDGLSDLLIGQHPRHLDVFVGVPGPDLFSRRPQDVAVASPNLLAALNFLQRSQARSFIEETIYAKISCSYLRRDSRDSCPAHGRFHC